MSQEFSKWSKIFNRWTKNLRRKQLHFLPQGVAAIRCEIFLVEYSLCKHSFIRIHFYNNWIFLSKIVCEFIEFPFDFKLLISIFWHFWRINNDLWIIYLLNFHNVRLSCLSPGIYKYLWLLDTWQILLLFYVLPLKYQ